MTKCARSSAAARSASRYRDVKEIHQGTHDVTCLRLVPVNTVWSAGLGLVDGVWGDQSTSEASI